MSRIFQSCCLYNFRKKGSVCLSQNNIFDGSKLRHRRRTLRGRICLEVPTTECSATEIVIGKLNLDKAQCISSRVNGLAGSGFAVCFCRNLATVRISLCLIDFRLQVFEHAGIKVVLDSRSRRVQMVAGKREIFGHVAFPHSV